MKSIYLALACGKLDDKMSDSKLGQRLPRAYKLHLRVHRTQARHVGVRFEYPLNNLWFGKCENSVMR